MLLYMALIGQPAFSSRRRRSQSPLHLCAPSLFFPFLIIDPMPPCTHTCTQPSSPNIPHPTMQGQVLVSGAPHQLWGQVAAAPAAVAAARVAQPPDAATTHYVPFYASWFRWGCG